jgi:hypothetical protein
MVVTFLYVVWQEASLQDAHNRWKIANVCILIRRTIIKQWTVLGLRRIADGFFHSRLQSYVYVSKNCCSILTTQIWLLVPYFPSYVIISCSWIRNHRKCPWIGNSSQSHVYRWLTLYIRLCVYFCCTYAGQCSSGGICSSWPRGLDLAISQFWRNGCRRPGS